MVHLQGKERADYVQNMFGRIAGHYNLMNRLMTGGQDMRWRRFVVQQANREAARDQLRLAQDRYRLGSGNSLELSTAQNDVVRAEGDYINAVYDYHKAVAALEAAVGRPLR